jgi:hypothetical protein
VPLYGIPKNGTIYFNKSNPRFSQFACQFVLSFVLRQNERTKEKLKAAEPMPE